MSQVVTTAKTKCKASSTLNRSPLYTPKNVFDGNVETCWNSDQGLPQFLLVNFESSVNINKVDIMFQGGFVGSSGYIDFSSDGVNFNQNTTNFDFDDINALQSFSFPSISAQYLRINFLESTDFYGRITIYQLIVYGTVQ